VRESCVDAEVLDARVGRDDVRGLTVQALDELRKAGSFMCLHPALE